MKNNATVFLALAISIFVFTGCTNKIEPKPNKIIEDISKLQPSKGDKNTYSYIKKETSFSKYNHIIVPEINVYLAKDKEGAQKVAENLFNYLKGNTEDIKNEKFLNDLSLYFTKNLKKDLQRVVDDNREKKNSLIFQAAITSIGVSYDNLEFYQFIPSLFAFTAIKRSTGFEEKKLRVYLALKVLDKDTNETLVEILEHNISATKKTSSKDLEINDLKPILNEWIKKYSVKLQELKKETYEI